MKNTTHEEVRNKFLAFFENNGHTITKSASLIAPSESGTLFTTAGVQPFISQIMGQSPIQHTQVANVQKCLRTGDFDTVGDYSHLSFFEMLGSWSFGTYWKDTAIRLAFEFITTNKGLNIPVTNLYVTVFGGNTCLPADKESYEIWKKLGIIEDHIIFTTNNENWWSIDANDGPCGTCTEIFVGDSYMSATEIWNTVFMEYSHDGKILTPLPCKVVDQGAGLERLLAVMNAYQSGIECSVYDTDCLSSIVDTFKKYSALKLEVQETTDYITGVDAIRAILFLLADSPCLVPGGKGRNNILSKLCGKAASGIRQYEINIADVGYLFSAVVNIFKYVYPELREQVTHATSILTKFYGEQEEKAKKSQEKFLKDFSKLSEKFNKDIKNLFFMANTTYGTPMEFMYSIANSHRINIDSHEFSELQKQHQAISKRES